MEMISSAYNNAKNAVDGMTGSDIEKLVKDATNNKNWGVSGTIKSEISHYTHDFQGCKEVMGVVWKRLAEQNRNWRMVFKSLQLLDYLVKHGHERVANMARERQFQVKQLASFSFHDDEGRDRGAGIRELADQICELLSDMNRLRELRSDSKKQRKKFRGIAKTGFGSTGGTSFSDGFGNHDNGEKWGNEWKDSSKSKSNWDNTDADYSGKKKKKNKKKGKKSRKKEPEPEPEVSDYEEEESPSSSKKKKKRGKKKKDKKKKKSKSDDDFAEGEFDDDFGNDFESAAPAQTQSFDDFTFAPAPGASSNNNSNAGFDAFATSTTTSNTNSGFDDFDAFGTTAAPATNSGFGADFDAFQTASPAANTNSFNAFQTTAPSQPQPQPDLLSTFGTPNTAPTTNNNTNLFDMTFNTAPAPTTSTMTNNLGNMNIGAQPTAQTDFFNTPSSTQPQVNNTGFGAFATTTSAATTTKPVPDKKAPEPKKVDAWSMGNNLVDLDNMSNQTANYVTKPGSTRKSGRRAPMPSLSTYGHARPTNMGAMGPAMGNPGRPGFGGPGPQMGFGQPQMGRGMNPQMQGRGMNFGMNPQMNQGMNPQMGFGNPMQMQQQRPAPMMGMNANPSLNYGNKQRDPFSTLL